MRIWNLATLTGRVVADHGSAGFEVVPLLASRAAHVVTVRVEPGGVIGAHAAAARQLLVVVSGDASVIGAHGGHAELAPGQGVVWEPGEHHETRSRSGLLALVAEGELELVPGLD